MAADRSPAAVPGGAPTYDGPVAESGSDRHLLDLRGVACPLNFVRAKVALGRLELGAELEVLLDSGEPAVSVPRALREEGQLVLEEAPHPQRGVVRVVVKRAV